MNPQILTLVGQCVEQISAIHQAPSKRSRNTLYKKLVLPLLDLKFRIQLEGKDETLKAIREHYAPKINWVSCTPMLFQSREAPSQALRELLDSLA